MTRGRVPLIITALVLVLLYLPLIVLVINSFNGSKFGGEWGGATLKWYHVLWSHRDVWSALGNSLVIAVSATITSTIIGSLAAFSLYRYRNKFQKTHYALIYSPLVIPDVLVGVSLLIFFVLLNVSLGLFTIFIAHTTFCMSYVTLIMLAKLNQFDYALIEAAQDLGANSWTTFRRVLFPFMVPGLIAAALLAFTISIDDFVITFFVAGEGATTLPIYVYSMIKFGPTPIINALSTIILGVTLITISLFHFTVKEVT